jgi:Nucleoside 2-deoxyribosyltransferase like
MARVIKPPTPLDFDGNEPSVFLAGSIEMGQAEQWQSALEQALADLDVIVLNPRRDEWDASWVQSIDNPQFREQVEWELEAQERATLIAMYFAPATKAPVTLLELGLSARSGKLVVCCPEGFWRKGNVEVVCGRYGVPLVATLDELVAAVRQRLGAAGSAAQ